jgi:hypothetical protein
VLKKKRGSKRRGCASCSCSSCGMDSQVMLARDEQMLDYPKNPTITNLKLVVFFETTTCNIHPRPIIRRILMVAFSLHYFQRCKPIQCLAVSVLNPIRKECLTVIMVFLNTTFIMWQKNK